MALIHRNFDPATQESGDYTATHYVAPYASVSGASNDHDDLGASSWASATSSSTPTTLGTACARATAGDVVRCEPGVYTGDDNGSRSGPAAFEVVGGSTGNPVTIYAQYPAATNYGSTELYSELRRPLNNSSLPADFSSVMSGVYCIIDGFYLDEVNAPSAPSAGAFKVGGGNECVLRRIAIDRDTAGDVAYGNGHNTAPIYFSEENYDCVVSDCLIVGNSPNGGNPFNRAGIETYAAVRSTIEYCTFDGQDCCVYFKTNGSGTSSNDDTTMTFRYNKCLGGTHTIAYQRNESLTIHNNLITCNRALGADMVGMFYDQSIYTIQTDFLVHHNTIILTGDGTNYEPYIGGIGFDGGVPFQGTFRDNLIYMAGGTGELSFISMPTPTGNDMGDWTQFDYNHYYRTSGTPEWHHNGSDYTPLSSWQTAMSGFGVEQNSSYSDPEFTNYAGGDYTLASNGQDALTSSSTGGPVGCYITGNEEIGVRSNPTY